MEWQQAEIVLQDLLALHRRKHGLLVKMLGVTSERTSLNEEEQPEEILALVEARQSYMEKVDVLDAEIRRLTLRLNQLAGGEERPGNRPERLAGAWEKINEQRESCLKLVGEMQEMDRRQKPLLEIRLSKLKEMQKKVRVSRRTINAYLKNASQPESVFIDKRK
ncbi:MAG: hypothetical protein ACOY40_04515 [Bacillota bacterium]